MHREPTTKECMWYVVQFYGFISCFVAWSALCEGGLVIYGAGVKSLIGAGGGTGRERERERERGGGGEREH